MICLLSFYYNWPELMQICLEEIFPDALELLKIIEIGKLCGRNNS